MKCPDCGGRGSVTVHINRGNKPHEWRTDPCAFCSGTGWVSAVTNEEREKKREAGRAWYESQKRGDDSMIEVAQRLGMPLHEISKIRWGEAPIPGADGE